MSSSQQARNKQLHKLIDQLEDQIERLKTENANLRDLIPQAWCAGRSFASLNPNEPDLPAWLKQKGLA